MIDRHALFEKIRQLEEELRCRTIERDYHLRMADKLAERIKEMQR